jgi:hypothetical protein
MSTNNSVRGPSPGDVNKGGGGGWGDILSASPLRGRTGKRSSFAAEPPWTDLIRDDQSMKTYTPGMY